MADSYSVTFDAYEFTGSSFTSEVGAWERGRRKIMRVDKWTDKGGKESISL